MSDENQEPVEHQEKVQTLKLKFKSGRVIEVRQIEIDDQRKAARNVGTRCNAENQMELATELQYEIAKLIVVSIDGKPLKGMDKERLSKMLSFKEYTGLMHYVKEMMENEEDLPEVEFS